MKIFYDNDGNVVGQITGVSPEIEAKFSMPGHKEVTVPLSIAKRINNPKDSLHHKFMKVEGDKVLEMSDKEKKAIIDKEKRNDKWRQV